MVDQPGKDTVPSDLYQAVITMSNTMPDEAIAAALGIKVAAIK